jgi:hypothetical protein
VSKYAWQTVGKSTVFCAAFHCDIIIPRKCHIPRYGCYRWQPIQPCLDQGPLHQLCRGSWWSSLVDAERKGCLGKYVFTTLILGQCQHALLVFVFFYWAIGSFRTIYLIYNFTNSPFSIRHCCCHSPSTNHQWSHCCDRRDAVFIHLSAFLYAWILRHN